MSDFVQKRIIELPQNQQLEIEMTQEFIDKLVQHFELSDESRLTDDQIRLFVWGSLNTANKKAEKP